MRRAARIDDNHPEIRRAYRHLGCTVLDTFQLGKGAPDMIVSMYGINDLVEVKDGSKPPSARKLTPDEIDFHNAWNSKVWVIESVDDVVKHVEDIRRRWNA